MLCIQGSKTQGGQSSKDVVVFRPETFSLSTSFNRQNIGKSGDFKDFLHHFIDMQHFHAAFFHHGLVGRKKHTQAGRRDIFKIAEIQGQAFCASEGFAEFCFQFRRGHRIQTSLECNGHISAVQSLGHFHSGQLSFFSFASILSLVSDLFADGQYVFPVFIAVFHLIHGLSNKKDTQSSDFPLMTWCGHVRVLP